MACLSWVFILRKSFTGIFFLSVAKAQKGADHGRGDSLAHINAICTSQRLERLNYSSEGLSDDAN